jgi:predicted metallo-beta-lactamase superfamily hydrolase
VPWWPAERNPVTLHHILVRVTADTSRHAGHADIVRELIDGATGLAPARSNLPPHDQAWWQAHHARVERAARAAAGGAD